jgi:hypothetical protein
MRKFSHQARLREINEMRGKSPPPDFQDIQRVFYELHQTNEFQDKEFLQLLFPTVHPVKLENSDYDHTLQSL